MGEGGGGCLMDLMPPFFLTYNLSLGSTKLQLCSRWRGATPRVPGGYRRRTRRHASGCVRSHTHHPPSNLSPRHSPPSSLCSPSVVEAAGALPRPPFRRHRRLLRCSCHRIGDLSTPTSPAAAALLASLTSPTDCSQRSAEIGSGSLHSVATGRRCTVGLASRRCGIV